MAGIFGLEAFEDEPPDIVCGHLSRRRNVSLEFPLAQRCYEVVAEFLSPQLHSKQTTPKAPDVRALGSGEPTLSAPGRQ
jgi:hypothetical protein